MLDRAMEGERLEAAFVRLPSPGLVTRRSSDVGATSDPLAAAAARFIADHAGQPVAAADVAVHADASRRTLELRFRKAFGRSIGQLLLPPFMAAFFGGLPLFAYVAKSLGF